MAETPLGQTPWSASGTGHDPEEVETGTGSSDSAQGARRRVLKPARRRSNNDNYAGSAEFQSRVHAIDRLAKIRDWLLENPTSTYEPLRAMLEQHMTDWQLQLDAEMRSDIRAEADQQGGLPPGTIQACAEGERYVV